MSVLCCGDFADASLRLICKGIIDRVRDGANVEFQFGSKLSSISYKTLPQQRIQSTCRHIFPWLAGIDILKNNYLKPDDASPYHKGSCISACI